MIANLSAYIQFLAAIYVTICIDSLICRRFWSPDYYNLVTAKLSLFANTISTPKRNKLEEQIREKEHILDSRSRKRGAIMLTYCLLLLWYIGFEKTCTGDMLIIRNIPLAALCLLTVICLLCCKWLSARWRYTLAACFALFLSFAILVLYVQNFAIPVVKLWWLVYTKRVISILILLPIFYQLYVNWLYSKAYILYLNHNIDDEYGRYSSSKKGFEEKNEQLVDPSYDSAFRKILLNKMEGDNAMTELNNLLYEHLKECCSPPNPYQIIKNWWSCKEDDNVISPSISANDSNTDIVSDDVIEPFRKNEAVEFPSIIVEKYKKYKETKPAPKLTDFCVQEQIEEETFRSYHNLQKSMELQNVGLRGRKKNKKK